MDTDHQADDAWLLSVQCKLYQWSRDNPEDAWRDMWNWVTDLRNLRQAWRRVASNAGRGPHLDWTLSGLLQRRTTAFEP